MTKYLERRAGKLLFPRLPHDQRKQRLSIVMLVFLTSIFGNGTLVMWILWGGRRFF